MNDYILEDNASSNDELAIYVLVESTDVGAFSLKQVMGVSYNLDCIEKMLSELKTKPESDDSSEYYVYRRQQQDEHAYIPAFERKEPVKGNCYLIARGYASDAVDNILGYYGDKEEATQAAEYAMSFYEAYDEIYIINTPMDRLLDLNELEVGAWDEDEWQIIFE